VTIRGGEFRRVRFVRGDLVEARVSGVDMNGARFGDTILDDAVFEDCDLRGANFGTAKELFAHRGTTTNPVFRRCDLRGAKFAGRTVSGAVFVDCKLHGITGPARRMAALEVAAPTSRRPAMDPSWEPLPTSSCSARAEGQRPPPLSRSRAMASSR
jgi:hypothetical protein